MEAIRNENPDWQYVPTNRLAAELVEPMPRRLRPRNRLKKKVSRHAFILFSKLIFLISVVRAFVYGAMGRRSNPSWWTH